MLLIAEADRTFTPQYIFEQAVALCAAMDAQDMSQLGRRRVAFRSLRVANDTTTPSVMQLLFGFRTIEVTATSNPRQLATSVGQPSKVNPFSNQ